VKEHGGSFIYWPGSHHIAWQYFRECPDDYLAQGCRSQDQVFARINKNDIAAGRVRRLIRRHDDLAFADFTFGFNEQEK
jgi:hypothetical protein